MVKLRNNIKIFENESSLGSFLTKYEANCALYSKEGTKFDIHKEIMYQTKFMRNILQSVSNSCGENMEILCPCSEEELETIVNFFYRWLFLREELKLPTQTHVQIFLRNFLINHEGAKFNFPLSKKNYLIKSLKRKNTLLSQGCIAGQSKTF